MKIIETIQFDGSTYRFPDDLRAVTAHPELAAIPAASRAISQIERRGMCRNIFVKMPENVKILYLDEDGNIHFRGTYLEEIGPSSISSVSVASHPNPTEKPTSLKTLTKDIMLETFSGRNQNASSWIKLFEKECIRMEIPVQRYAEAIRLFLDGPAADWHCICIKLIGIEENWTEWHESFLETFGPKGWSELASAYFYKYIKGSLSEYALRKIRLLIEADPGMPMLTRINLVILCLPTPIRDRLDRNMIQTQNELISELNSLEHLAEKEKEKPIPQNKLSDKVNRKQCPHCEKAGFPARFHPTSTCWNNPDNPNNRISLFAKKKNPSTVKVVNNVEFQDMINESIPDQKN